MQGQNLTKMELKHAFITFLQSVITTLIVSFFLVKKKPLFETIENIY